MKTRFGQTDVWAQCTAAGVHKDGSGDVEFIPGFAPNGRKALLLINSATPGANIDSAMVLLSPSLALNTVNELMKVIMQKRIAVGFKLADVSFRDNVFIVGDDFDDDDLISLSDQGINPIQVEHATQAALANAIQDMM